MTENFEHSGHQVTIRRPEGQSHALARRDSRLAVAGLFAGIGGFEEGFRRCGHEAVMFCENDPFAQKVLRAKFPGTSLVSDIRSLDKLPQCDVVTAGFPCQDLSQVGATKGISGSNSSLVRHVIRLIENADEQVRWLILENVPFMLRLQKGRAIREITQSLTRLGWAWAYRTIDTRAFGLPQRRRRVFLLASRTQDPRPALLGEDAGDLVPELSANHACGFYWTEGHNGLGWVPNAIPPLKGGSGLSIPSPPAIWFPKRRAVCLPAIEDAERLQGFSARWTESVRDEVSGDRRRWKLVGNAVSVPVAQWIAKRLETPGEYHSVGDVVLARGEAWPNAAWQVRGVTCRSNVSMFPVRFAGEDLESFLLHKLNPISLRAASGFLARIEHSGLRTQKKFIADMQRSVASARKAAPETADLAVSRRMARTRGRDNPQEVALRSALHKEGMRFRIQMRMPEDKRRTIDIAFPALRVALFLDGCFWHGCPMHGTWPKRNAKWWREKINANRKRDQDTDARLKAKGWHVIRIWEHEDTAVAARRIARIVDNRRKRITKTRR